MTHWQRFVSQLKRDAKRKALFDFVADDRTCSEQSERNSETGEFIRYSEASAAQVQVANKVCDNAVCIVASPSPQYKEKTNPNGSFNSYMVRMTGLEPARACTRT